MITWNEWFVNFASKPSRQSQVGPGLPCPLAICEKSGQGGPASTRGMKQSRTCRASSRPPHSDRPASSHPARTAIRFNQGLRHPIGRRIDLPGEYVQPRRTYTSPGPRSRTVPAAAQQSLNRRGRRIRDHVVLVMPRLPHRRGPRQHHLFPCSCLPW